MNSQLDRLFSILSHKSFLTMQGLANEVPIFIQPYDVEAEDKTASLIRALAQRLRSISIYSIIYIYIYIIYVQLN